MLLYNSGYSPVRSYKAMVSYEFFAQTHNISTKEDDLKG